MKGWKRYLTPVLVGLLTYLVVLYWPAPPRWTKRLDDSNRSLAILDPQCVTERLFVTEQFRQEDVGLDIVELNVSDGRELSRFRLPAEEGAFYVSLLRLLPGRDQLFVVYEWYGEFGTRNAANARRRTQRYAVVDIHTGKRLCGLHPFEGDESVLFSPDDMVVFSPDGTMYFAKDTVYQVDSGTISLKLPADLWPVRRVCFSPDNTRLAVLWRKFLDSFVTVLDLRTGKTIAQRQLPPEKDFEWGRLSWREQTLMLSTYGTSNDPVSLDPAYALDAVGDGLGEARRDPELDEYTNREPYGCVVAWRAGTRRLRMLYGEPSLDLPLRSRMFGWIDSTFGTKLHTSEKDLARIEVCSRDNHRVLLEAEAKGYQVAQSPGAAWLAVVNRRGELEMWDAQPFPRWPAALGAGLVVGVGVTAFRTWRGRRRNIVAAQAPVV